jgi:anti-anti-sigma regulatory factor
MADAPETDGFALEDGVLRCPYDMNAFLPKELRSWCERLLESPKRTLTVDLSGTRHVASHHLGTLSEVWNRLLGEGRDLIVVISPELRRVFTLSGFDQVFKLVEKPET